MDKDKNTFEVIESAVEKGVPRTTRRKDGFSRMDVVNAFSTAFEMIGGVPRLALWANANPDKFYPLYAKLMPSTSIAIQAEDGKLIIEHAIPQTPLDNFDDVPVAQEVFRDEDNAN